jgi:hypothetical protein
MSTFITPPDALLAECLEVQAYCELTCSDSPDEIAERIAALCVHIARTGKMLADAKYHLAGKMGGEVDQLIHSIADGKKLSAKVQNAKAESLCREEHYLVNAIERLNRTATHQLEAMRSLLSYEKEHLRVAKIGY